MEIRWPMKMDEVAATAALGAFFGDSGRTMELRALWEKGARRPRVWRGEDPVELIQFAKLADRDLAKGIYVVMNPFGEVGGAAVSDVDVTRREWLLIDVDPVRPSGSAATSAEMKSSLRVVVDVRSWLMEKGFPEPFVGQSGNGGHLMWRVDLGTEDLETDLIKRCLEALAWRFDSDSALIDQGVFNLSRIWKLPGTVSRKGIATEERPWRLAQLRKIGSDEVVSRELLEELAGSVDIGEANAGDEAELGRLRAWLHANWPELGEPKSYLNGTGRRWVFKTCPWNESHRDRSSYVIRFSSGAIIAGCLHENCMGKGKNGAGKSLGWRRLQKLAKKPFKREVEKEVVLGASTAAAPRATHLGNSKRLAGAYTGEMLYVPQWGSWLMWDGKRWMERVGHAERLAKTLSGIVFKEAERAEAAEEEKLAKRLFKWANACESQSQIMSALRLAQSDLAFERPAERFDVNPWTLNCQNGVLDLRDGTLSPHRRDALLTKISNIDFDAKAKAPLWRKFLDDIFDGDEDLIAFIQRSIGYCLTGSVKEQVMFLCHGDGSNGKTTFVRAIQHVLADYSTQVDSKLLMQSRNDAHPTGLTDLRGKRFAGAAESDRGKQLAEAMIKQLTGDDIITARRMRQDFIRFEPSHKLWLLVNHKPIIKGNDLGIWRRIIYVPFTVTITEDRKDRELLSKLKLEAAGILAWAVEGCLQWQKVGLKPPDCVVEGVKNYREDMDILKDFFTECCVVGAKFRVPKRDLFEAYMDWCEPRNQRPGNINFFGRLLRERGFEETVAKVTEGERRRSIQMWRGLRLGSEVPGTVVEVDFA